MKGLILGSPGSGKGTISKKIATQFPIHILSTGDVLRKEIQKKSILGSRAVQGLEKGELVSDDIMFKLLSQELIPFQNSHWLLDGFPRSLDQARFLDSVASLDIVFHLDVPTSVILERISSTHLFVIFILRSMDSSAQWTYLQHSIQSTQNTGERRHHGRIFGKTMR